MKTGAVIRSRALVLTAPVPQALALLAAGGCPLPADWRARLEAIVYRRCLAVLAVLDAPSQLPGAGYWQPTDSGGPIVWLGDNQRKGVSPEPAVTLHGSDAFSRAHWEPDQRMAAGAELLRVAAPLLGAGVKEYQVHGWRYSKPGEREDADDACAVVPAKTGAAGAEATRPVILAGDAFGGPRVEGAITSGWAAAAAVLGAASGSTGA